MDRSHPPVLALPARSVSSTEFAVPSFGISQPPGWVAEWVALASEQELGRVRIRRSQRFALVSLSVPDAGSVNGSALERMAAEAYRTIARQLHCDPPWHPVRIWNFVPGILSGGGEGLDRYMRFNAGRHLAFTEWFDGAGDFNRVLPAASAVGHGGRDLVICALACREPGTAVANPRQRAPYHYSKRFGPLPPCFARATRVSDAAGREFLLAGGTASIRGEESVHVGDLDAQLAETFENLAALVRAAWPDAGDRQPLGRFRELRVYYVRKQDLPAIRRSVAESFSSLAGTEWIHADLCRPDLLVEIEGRAAER